MMLHIEVLEATVFVPLVLLLCDCSSLESSYIIVYPDACCLLWLFTGQEVTLATSGPDMMLVGGGVSTHMMLVGGGVSKYMMLVGEGVSKDMMLVGEGVSKYTWLVGGGMSTYMTWVGGGAFTYMMRAGGGGGVSRDMMLRGGACLRMAVGGEVCEKLPCLTAQQRILGTNKKKKKYKMHTSPITRRLPVTRTVTGVRTPSPWKHIDIFAYRPILICSRQMLMERSNLEPHGNTGGTV